MIDINDRKFWPKEPEPGFSPARNKLVIENSIKKYEKKRAEAMTAFTKELRERTDALASFLKKKDDGYSGGVERYFGRKYLAELRGKEIIDKLSGNLVSFREKVAKGGGFRVDKDVKIDHGKKEQERKERS